MFDFYLLMWGEFVVPVLLFFGGAVYIALDTVRILFVGKGLRGPAAIMGFLEVIVFLLAVSEVLSGPFSIVNLLAYAGGFGFGTWLGGAIDEEVAIGFVLARIITRKDAQPLIDALGAAGYGVTNVAAKGQFGQHRLIFSVLRRKNVKAFMALVNQHNPKAFVTIEHVHTVHQAQEEIEELLGEQPAAIIPEA